MKETKMDQITTEMADQEELDEICADCKLGHYICDILNEHNKTLKSTEG